MKRQATKTPRARRDLAEIAAFIGFDSPSYADRFLDAARDEFNKLADMPGMGARRDELGSRFPTMRS